MEWIGNTVAFLAAAEQADWGLVSVVIGGCAGMGTLFMFATRSIVRDEISKLHTTYFRSDMGIEKFRQIETELESLRHRLNRLERDEN